MIDIMLTFDVNSFMRSHRRRFKGGGGGQDPPSSQMADTATKKYARSELYPMVERGLEGRGFGSGMLDMQAQKTLYGGLETAYGTAKSDLNSQMSRSIESGDTRVKGFMQSSLDRSYISGKDEIARGLRAQKTADVDLSMGLATEYLAGEKRMSVNSGNSYNQALQGNLAYQQQYGTFGSNIAAGVGEGSMDYYYAQKMGQK